MLSPLVIFPIGLFFVAVLALVSGIAVITRQRSREGGLFTATMWAVFSGSVSLGFAQFGAFVYVTQRNAPLAIGIGFCGIILVLVSGWIAAR